jgi:hypothetical protein
MAGAAIPALEVFVRSILINIKPKLFFSKKKTCLMANLFQFPHVPEFALTSKHDRPFVLEKDF